ncbi:o-succinylbenzoate synthase [Halobacillus litoralis]|uniref:o-succinylbenzoate synthase n=1 Tax=Halobacillus litoralis TaxID=45668 RepID=UPI00249362F6|nr:o-succinylbenzoate synthase [Halobacillus litoralis]
MNIDRITLRKIVLPLKSPFVTHHGRLEERPLIIVEARDGDGRVGYGEVTAFPTPFYTSETIHTAWYVLQELLIPSVLSKNVHHPKDIGSIMEGFQGHPMAKAGLEGSLWDLYSKQEEVSLSQLIGGTRKFVTAGAVISLRDDMESYIHDLKKDGYHRYKLKVKKGYEHETIETVQEIDPDLPIMIDANGQYDEKDIDHLKSLDQYGLMMLEQPFAPGDFYLHRELQKILQTPLCLDESVSGFHDAVQGVQLESCQIINVKISRVGGLMAAIQIHDYCKRKGFPVWCGGMVESGISKAHNLALASLPNFTIPGDLSGSLRYFEKDIINPGIQINKGQIEVPQGPGIGVDVDEEYLHHVTYEAYTFSV